MAQIDNTFTAIWYDTSTWPWTPLTGLSATIIIRDKSNNTVVVNNEAMTEIGLWEYDYVFTGMDSTKAYSYVMNPNSALAYVETGFVDPRLSYIDKSVSEIAVGWNPYITWIGGIQNGIQRIVDKVESKWDEISKKIESEVKTIVIPKQKEPIVNVTTETIDTSGFIAEIKKIKPEVTVNTESVDISPILTAIKNIPQTVIPEPKEVDLSGIENSISSLSESIEDVKEDILEKMDEKKDIYEAIWALFEQTVNWKKKKEIEEEENLKKPFPSQFTARIK